MGLGCVGISNFSPFVPCHRFLRSEILSLIFFFSDCYHLIVIESRFDHLSAPMIQGDTGNGLSVHHLRFPTSAQELRLIATGIQDQFCNERLRIVC